MRIRHLSAILLAIVLTACGGGGGHPAVLPSSPSGAQPLGGNTAITLRINVQAPSNASSTLKREYVSPSTQSLVYVISQNGTPVKGGSGYVNLTTASSYCSSSGALQPLVCTAQVPVNIVASGNYTFNVATYDSQQTAQCTPGGTPACTGNELSDQNVTQTLTLGASNNVLLALGANAASIAVSPITPGYLQGDLHGLKLWGVDPENVAANALDADGNIIVGPGAPTIAVKSSSGTLNASAVSNQPNVFTLQAVGTGSPAVVTPGIVNLSVALAAADGGSVPSSAITVPVTVAHRALWVSDGGQNVRAYYDANLESSNPVAGFTISGFTGAQGVAVDASGTVYVSDESTNTVKEFPAGSTTASLTITSGLNRPYGIAVDSTGTVYVANYGGNDVTVYPRGATTPSETLGSTSGIGYALGVAVDASGTLYVSSGFNGTFTNLLVFPAGSTMPSQTITSGFSDAVDVAVDAHGTVYLTGDPGLNGTLLEYPAGSSAYAMKFQPAIAGYSTGIETCWGVAVDATGRVYLANEGGNQLTEYPPGTIAPTSAGGPNVYDVLMHVGYAPQYIAVIPASVQL